MGASVGPGDYAIKRIKPSNNELERPSVTSISTLREVSLLRELSHENIVNLTDVVIDPRERDVALVMDFVEWTLESVLKEHKHKQDRVSEFSCKAMLYQCLSGLKYMHENWVLHRDLKPQNILIMGDGPKRGLLQLADLGLARIFKNPLKALGNVDKTVVTLWYRAPELLLGTNHYTTAVDVWSMGCIFAELFFAHNSMPHVPPALFAGKQASVESKGITFEEDQCRKVFSILGLPSSSSWPEVDKLPNYEKLMELRDKLLKSRDKTTDKHGLPLVSNLTQRIAELAKYNTDKAAMDLLAGMLELNPTKRISAKDALNHQYFESFLKFPPNVRANALDDPTTIRKRSYPKVDPRPLDPHEVEAQKNAESAMRAALQNKKPRTK